ncbi:MAG: VWA domain-containing protein [Betaproteobacteria bacterium]|nr:VWA domain-containing protein [Betaproteobacteria bacterium]
MSLLRTPANESGRLPENVMYFARVLRTAGIPVGTHQVLAALDALAITGIGSRDDFYWTLASVFVDRREQRELFDQAFHMFWRDPDLLGRIMHMMLPRVEGLPTQRDKTLQRLQEAFARGAPETPTLPQQPEREIEIDALLSFSSRELLQDMDFESMSGAELAQAKQLIARLDLPLREVRTRRLVSAAHGRKFDARASLKAAISAHGGVIPLRRAAPRSVAPPLVVLVDISGSMSRYSRMFLHFVHALTNARQRVAVLLFGTRLTSITRELRQRDVDVALDRVATRVKDWAGGTRIGACLHDFNRLWSRRLLGQNACVLLLSDGLDREGGAGLAAEMERLHKSCRQLIWLNPLLRYDGFEARAAGVVAMRPHVDLFLPAHNLESLADLGRALAAPPRARRPEARAA